MKLWHYLAGMLAGSRAKKDGNEKIGYMATFPIPEELRLGNAIMLGVKKTCPECTMDIRFPPLTVQLSEPLGERTVVLTSRQEQK